MENPTDDERSLKSELLKYKRYCNIIYDTVSFLFLSKSCFIHQIATKK